MHKLYTAVSPKERGGSTATTEEYAGYTACDPRGQKIGRIERIFLNGRGEPEYIKVKLGYLASRASSSPCCRSPQTRSGAPCYCNEADRSRYSAP